MSARARILRLLYTAVAVAAVFLTGCKSGSSNPLTNPFNIKSY